MSGIWLTPHLSIPNNQKSETNIEKKIISIFGNAFLCCHNNLTCLPFFMNHKIFFMIIIS